MKNGRGRSFKSLLFLCFFYYFAQYLFDIDGEGSLNPLFIDMPLFVGFYIAYLVLYRKRNVLCFELMALPVAFLGLFFDDIIYPFSPELSSFFSISDIHSKIKSEDIQMASFFALLLGGTIGNDHNIIKKTQEIASVGKSEVNYNFLINIVAGILLLLIVYDYVTGIFSSWFYYSNADVMDVEDRSQGLGHLTCLLLAASSIEVVRLRDKGVTDLKMFIRKINKIFVVEWIFVSFLLYISGNRNEMLLILLPLIVAYTVCIKKLSNKSLFISGAIGVVLMAIAGMTRQDKVSLTGSQLGVLSFTRDFADLGYNTDFLVDYTDKNGATYFQGFYGTLLSVIPYLGSVILNAINYKPVDASATLTTESVTASSGLGTSLIGDLYYTAGFAWVVVFMFLLGYVMSRLYHADKSLNIYWLVFYSYMVANAVYYIRSSWSFPITVIEYAFIIIFLGSMFFRVNKKKAVVKE